MCFCVCVCVCVFQSPKSFVVFFHIYCLSECRIIGWKWFFFQWSFFGVLQGGSLFDNKPLCTSFTLQRLHTAKCFLPESFWSLSFLLVSYQFLKLIWFYILLFSVFFFFLLCHFKRLWDRIGIISFAKSQIYYVELVAFINYFKFSHFINSANFSINLN